MDGVAVAVIVGGLILLGGGRARAAGPVLARWPVLPAKLGRIGDALGAGRGHQGVDLFAPAGTDVVAPERMKIIRVVNGSASASESQKRAGQWVDAEGIAGRILRFLHLAPSPPVKAGQVLDPGDLVGHIAPTGSSGNMNSPPHLHFEVRGKPGRGQAYGPPLNPLSLLPPTGRKELDQRMKAAA